MKESKSQKNKAPLHLIGTTIHHQTRGLYNRSQKIINSFLIGNLLGSGGFASCFRATRLKDDALFAIKIIDKNSENMKKSGAKIRLQTEIEIMKRCHHKNIVRLFQVFEDQNYHYFILELCEKISLHEMLRFRKRLMEYQVKYFMKQLLEVLQYLRSVNILHRDIKSCNIMLDYNLNIKLGDFGLATYQNLSARPQRYTQCGTPNFMSPEIVKKQKYSYQVDIWSAGIVAFSLLTGTLPFNDKDSKKIHEKIITLKYKFPDNCYVSTSAKNFIRSILVLNKHDRITAQKALQHEFLKNSPQQLPLTSYKICPDYDKISIKDTKRNYFRIVNRQIMNKVSSSIKQKDSKISKQLDFIDPFSKNKTPKKINNKSKQIKEVPTVKKQFIISQKQIVAKNGQQLLSQKLDRFIIKNEKPQKEKQKQEKIDVKKNIQQQKNQNIKMQVQDQYNYKIQQQASSILQQVNKNKKNKSSDKEKTLSFQMIEDIPFHCWMQQKLNKELYVYQFMDRSNKFGICLHLSNSLKVILFNDCTIMAAKQLNAESILYICKQEGSGKKITKFYGQKQIIADHKIIKKWGALKNFINKTTKLQLKSQKDSQSELDDEREDLLKSAKYVRYWCKWNKDKSKNNNFSSGKLAYLFSTLKNIQIIFTEDFLNVFICKSLNCSNTVLIAQKFGIKQEINLSAGKQKLVQLLGKKKNQIIISLLEHLVQVTNKSNESMKLLKAQHPQKDPASHFIKTMNNEP